MRIQTVGRAMLAATVLCTSLAAAGSVSGTLTFVSKGHTLTVTPTFVAYITGPDDFDATQTVRRLMFSTTDLTAKIRGCDTLACPDAAFQDGLEVDLVAGPRLNYWFVTNRQLVQHSGTADPAVFTASADTPQRLAGTIAFDDARVGGASVSLTFDTPLTKAFSKAR